MNEEIYTVQFQNGSVHQLEEKYLHKSNPSHQLHLSDPPPFNKPPWLKNACKCTIFLNTLVEPCQGKLYQNTVWRFIPNNRIKHSTIDSPT